MVIRRCVALALAALGVGAVWGAGFGLLVAGAGLWLLEAEPHPGSWKEWRTSARQGAAQAPRRVVAASMAAVGIVGLGVAVGVEWGWAWGALVAASLLLLLAALLGWEG